MSPAKCLTAFLIFLVCLELSLNVSGKAWGSRRRRGRRWFSGVRRFIGKAKNFVGKVQRGLKIGQNLVGMAPLLGRRAAELQRRHKRSSPGLLLGSKLIAHLRRDVRNVSLMACNLRLLLEKTCNTSQHSAFAKSMLKHARDLFQAIKLAGGVDETLSDEYCVSSSADLPVCPEQPRPLPNDDVHAQALTSTPGPCRFQQLLQNGSLSALELTATNCGRLEKIGARRLEELLALFEADIIIK